MKLSSLLPMVMITAASIAGCSDSTTPPSQKPPLSPDSTYQYQVLVQNLRHVEPAQHLVLWFKMKGASEWRVADTMLYSEYGLYDSLRYKGTILGNLDPNLIDRAMVSVEPNTHVSAPTAKLIAGNFDKSTNTAPLLPNDVDGIGDYSSADANVTFTTKSADTNRAKFEFYLMELVSGKPSPGTQNLMVPHKGWVYSLWVTNPNFFPAHKFYYGSFTNPNGPDSDPTNDSFNFPGGYKASPLNDAGATLSLVLEPEFAVQSHTDPSQFAVLRTGLQRFINFDQTMSLLNVTQSTIPTATLRIYK